jgi:hypothetical protein
MPRQIREELLVPVILGAKDLKLLSKSQVGRMASELDPC